MKELEALQATVAEEEEFPKEPGNPPATQAADTSVLPEPEPVQARPPARPFAVDARYAGVLDRMLQRPSVRKVLDPPEQSKAA